MISMAGAGTVALGLAGVGCCVLSLGSAIGPVFFSDDKELQLTAAKAFMIAGFALMGGSFCYMSYWIGKSLIWGLSGPLLDISIKVAAVGFVCLFISNKINEQP